MRAESGNKAKRRVRQVRVILALLIVMVAGSPGFVAHAQSEPEGVVQVMVQDREYVLSDSLAWHSDPDVVAADAISGMHREGYHFAEISSVEVDRTAQPQVITVHIDRGPLIPIGKFELRGLTVEQERLYQEEIGTSEGEVLEQEQLERDIERLLALLDEEGYPLAQVTVEEVQFLSEVDSSLAVVLEVDRGDDLVFGGIQVDDDIRARSGFLERVIGLQQGDQLTSFNSDRVQEDLEGTELFRTVGEPAVEVTGGRAVLHLPLEEEGPGVFDLALGYQPEGQGGGSIVGSGHVQLRNPFGGGRLMSFRLDQRPGAVSTIEASATDPYILNTPFSLGVAFEGRQQDSTYNQQTYRVEAGYDIGRLLNVHVSAERRQTQPGIGVEEASRATGGVKRGSRNMFGAGITLSTTRRQLAPRDGYRLSLHAARGYQQQRGASSGQGASAESIPQEVIKGQARGYWSPWTGHVLAAGAEGEALISESYDDADLLRIGGARSLRGYDEEHFAGWMTGRMLAEYRLMTGVRSYTYLFADLGYVAETEVGAGTGEQRFLPGFGAGTQFETAIGIFQIAYAMNDQDTFMDGRLHLQLSIGL